MRDDQLFTRGPDAVGFYYQHKYKPVYTHAKASWNPYRTYRSRGLQSCTGQKMEDHKEITYSLLRHEVEEERDIQESKTIYCDQSRNSSEECEWRSSRLPQTESTGRYDANQLLFSSPEPTTSTSRWRVFVRKLHGIFNLQWLRDRWTSSRIRYNEHHRQEYGVPRDMEFWTLEEGNDYVILS